MAYTANGLVELLRHEMREKKLSNVEMGKQLGRSDVTIGNWLKGLSLPDADSQAKIAAYFGLAESALNRSLRGEDVGERELLLDKINQRLRPLSVAGLRRMDRALDVLLEESSE